MSPVTWEIFKRFIDARKVGFDTVDLGDSYWLIAVDGGVELECFIDKDASDRSAQDELEFKYKNRKPAKNTSQLSALGAIQSVLNAIYSKIPGAQNVVQAKQPMVYSAAVASFSFAGSATDVFTIRGSDKKLVRVRRIEVSMTANIALGATTTVELQLVKRSTKNTGGSSTSLTGIPHDSKDPKAEALVAYYTSNPTLGTLVGAVRTAKVTVPSVNTGVLVPQIEWQFENPILLRDSREALAVNLNGNTIASDLNAINIEWDEL